MDNVIGMWIMFCSGHYIVRLCFDVIIANTCPDS